ncbi:MAG: hypothetical protein WCF46_09865 [Nitrososphaeraceae archaeon]
MVQQQQLLKPKETVSQILRTYGKQFTQARPRYSDGHNGRRAAGVIMSYYGWNGKGDSQAAGKLLDVTNTLRQAGIRRDFVVKLNDSGLTFGEIADNLDRTNELTTLK